MSQQNGMDYIKTVIALLKWQSYFKLQTNTEAHTNFISWGKQ
jgi:hypothetical protein